MSNLCRPLELLDANQSIHTVDSHGVYQLVWSVHLADRLGRFMFLILRLLNSDDLAILKGDQSLHITAVRSGFVKLFVKLKLELHSFERGGCLDVPLPPRLCDLPH